MLKTLAFALTHAGTLAVAALMFFGEFAAFTILLALAGMVRLLTLLAGLWLCRGVAGFTLRHDQRRGPAILP